MPEPVKRFMGGLRRHAPTRESLERTRFLKPFARHLGHPELWRMSGHSVPRGVALGLFVGVIIPVMHTVIASLLAIPTRANVAVAAGITLVVNPLTMPPLYYAAFRIGSWELHHDARLLDPAVAERVTGELGRVLFWIHEASGPIAAGVLTIAFAAAAFGYIASALLWRWRQGHEVGEAAAIRRDQAAL